MANEIKYQKLFTLGGEKSDYVPETNENIIQDIMKIPAVTMRGHRDELIEFDSSVEEPILVWRKGMLDTFDNYSLIILRAFAQRRHEHLGKKY